MGDHKRRLHIGEVESMQSDSKHHQYFNGKRSVHNLGAGDSFYVPNFIAGRYTQDVMFGNLLEEVQFVQMFNFDKQAKRVYPIPRMVSAQTTKQGDATAIYWMQ